MLSDCRRSIAEPAPCPLFASALAPCPPVDVILADYAWVMQASNGSRDIGGLTSGENEARKNTSSRVINRETASETDPSWLASTKYASVIGYSTQQLATLASRRSCQRRGRRRSLCLCSPGVRRPNRLCGPEHRIVRRSTRSHCEPTRRCTLAPMRTRSAARQASFTCCRFFLASFGRSSWPIRVAAMAGIWLLPRGR